MPCADGATLVRQPKQKSETIKATHSQDKDRTDSCSPFCQCACCAGFSMNYSIAIVSTIAPYLEIPKTSFLSSEVIEIALPIWQPPQIV